MLLPRLRFATEVLLLQITVVVAIVTVSTAVFVTAGLHRLEDEAKATALAVAQSLAEDVDVRAQVATFSADPGTPSADDLLGGSLMEIARAVERRTGALFVVITDDHGIRLAHPNSSELGQPVSTSPAAALAGHEVVSWESGTLGESARAKVPVYAPGSDVVVGEVSVGYARAHVFDSILNDSVPVIAAALLALALGVGSAILLTRRLRRLTLDLQPEELVALVHDQEAVLSGVDEGVIGLTGEGRVMACNDFVTRHFGVAHPVGRDLATLGLPGELVRFIRHTPVTVRRDAETLVLEQRVMFIDLRPVFRDGVCLGRVVIIRDRTDVEALSRRLDAVAAMTTALRAQRHEFANRLHTISGLITIGKNAEAQSYLAGILEHGPLRYPVGHAERLTEPYLQAFVGAKGVEAAEKGVSLRCGPETLVTDTLGDPEDVTAVLGNLIDNAVAAAVSGPRRPAWVEVEVMDAGAELHLAVLDSGAGVSVGHIFERPPARGETTETVDDRVHGRGFGLPLSRDIARRRGGDVWCVPDESNTRGALFCARLPGVVIPAPCTPEETR
ncbi:sensor histidine kinase [Klugiella xanthotipulae]|uniref:sensor histidine kinase n=1 Tax=Klugiella xanthotipulae TaxID=244735 RepID=UPI001FE6C98A|nr:sensor histidine kinase [Klugiella xanthotipulae]